MNLIKNINIINRNSNKDKKLLLEIINKDIKVNYNLFDDYLTKIISLKNKLKLINLYKHYNDNNFFDILENDYKKIVDKYKKINLDNIDELYNKINIIFNDINKYYINFII